MPIAANQVNSLALTCLPNAPTDPVTGLQVPTIAVAVGTGNAGQVGTVLMNDGTAVNYSQASNDGIAVSFTKRGEVMWGISASSAAYVMPLATANVASVSVTARSYGIGLGPGVPVGAKAAVLSAGNVLTARTQGTNGNVLSFIRENPSTPTQGLGATITGTYSTGWMVGDIRRSLAADTQTGTASGAELVTNGTFDTNSTGWTAFGGATLAVVGGQLQITADASGINQGARQILTGLTIGKTYRVLGTSSRTSGTGSVLTSIQTKTEQAGTADFSFMATQTSHTLDLYIQAPSSGAVALFDNISMKELIADRSVKAKNSSINGTLAMTAVA